MSLWKSSFSRHTGNTVMKSFKSVVSENKVYDALQGEFICSVRFFYAEIFWNVEKASEHCVCSANMYSTLN
jgi:hypothetical protein